MAGIKLRNIQYTWYFRTWKKLIWKEREKDVERQEMSWNCCIERHMNFKTWPTENLIYSSSRDIVKKSLTVSAKKERSTGYQRHQENKDQIFHLFESSQLAPPNYSDLKLLKWFCARYSEQIFYKRFSAWENSIDEIDSWYRDCKYFTRK